jgi:hypothetical protein
MRTLLLSTALAVIVLGSPSVQASFDLNQPEPPVIAQAVTLADLRQEFAACHESNQPAVGIDTIIARYKISDDDFKNYCTKGLQLPGDLDPSTSRAAYSDMLTSSWFRGKIALTNGEDSIKWILKRASFYKKSSRLNIPVALMGILAQLNSVITGDAKQSYRDVACFNYVELVMASTQRTPRLLQSCWNVLADHYKGRSRVANLYRARLVLEQNCYPAGLTKAEAVRLANRCLQDIDCRPAVSTIQESQGQGGSARASRISEEFRLSTMRDAKLQALKTTLLEKAQEELKALQAEGFAAEILEDDILPVPMDENDDIVGIEAVANASSLHFAEEVDDADSGREASSQGKRERIDHSKKGRRLHAENLRELRCVIEESPVISDKHSRDWNITALSARLAIGATTVLKEFHRMGKHSVTNERAEREDIKEVIRRYRDKEITNRDTMLSEIMGLIDDNKKQASYVYIRVCELFPDLAPQLYKIKQRKTEKSDSDNASE